MNMLERYIRENDILLCALNNIATIKREDMTWEDAVVIANRALAAVKTMEEREAVK